MCNPSRPPLPGRVRLALAAGCLDQIRLRRRIEEAARLGVLLIDVLGEAELLHVQFVAKALGEHATWRDALAVMLQPPTDTDRPDAWRYGGRSSHVAR